MTHHGISAERIAILQHLRTGDGAAEPSLRQGDAIFGGSFGKTITEPVRAEEFSSVFLLRYDFVDSLAHRLL